MSNSPKEAVGSKLVQNIHILFTYIKSILSLASVIQAATLSIETKFTGTIENIFPPGHISEGRCLIEGEDKNYPVI